MAHFTSSLCRLVRRIIDLRDDYYLAGEYMECNVCNGTFISWDNQMLTVDVHSCFPAVLTRKYGCDMAVVGLLRARTLGNSTLSQPA